MGKICLEDSGGIMGDTVVLVDSNNVCQLAMDISHIHPQRMA